MDVSKTLISMSVSVALLGGFWGSAVAKKSDEEDSVYRWGRWAVLSPAAGQEEVIAFAPAGSNDLGRCDSSANCPDPTPPEKEVEKFDAKPVGYARIDYRQGGVPQAYPRHVGSFTPLYQDGDDIPDGYIVAGPSAPDGNDVNLNPGFLTVIPIAPDNFRSTDVGGNALAGMLVYGDDGEVAILRGSWSVVGQGANDFYRGAYVHGFTASSDQMAALMDSLDFGGDIIAEYSGQTMTGGQIDLDFNLTDNTWNANVQGRVMNFEANGTLQNAEFVADQFSDNVSRGAMQGALVNAGNNAIGSFVVESDIGEGGLLREADIFDAGLTTGTPALTLSAQ